MKIRIKTKKLKIIVEDDGSILGEYSKVWKARTKELLRARIPVSYTDWRQVPKSLKDDVWNALMGEFELNIPPDVARPLMVKSWSQKFRTFKTKLRSRLKNDDALGGEPKGVDPRTWRKFVENESDPKKQHQNVQNAENRNNLGSSHCFGRHSCVKQCIHRSVQNAENQKNLDSSHCFGTKQNIMQQDHPERPARQADELLAVPGRIDQTVLEIARLAYEEIMAAENGRKSTSLSGEGCSDTCGDLIGNDLTEVLRKDTTGQVCAVGSHLTEKQQIHVGVAKTTIEQNNKANEKAALTKDEIISHVSSRLDDFEDIMRVMLSKLSNVRGSAPPTVTTPVRELGSNSGGLPSHLSHNLDSVFATVGVFHPPTPNDKSLVILLDKFGKELAKGYVVTDAIAGVCHFKKVGIGEKKVFVEEVIEPNAQLWDPPQGGHNTLAGYVQGGFLIWLECWLKYI